MENTIEMLSMLNKTELAAVIKAFVGKTDGDNPFRAMTEEQIYDKIDKALANAKKGMYRYSEDFEKELLSECGA